MQLYALKDKSPILAQDALRSQTYLCPECHSPVRLRGGRFKQLHFFHIRKPRHCRQHQKSIAHLHIQLYLKSIIPEIELEKPFMRRSRIADACWEKERIIFEVQCSPISAEEAKLRTSDYEALGYRVVWLLYDQRYNQRRLTEAEVWLRTKKTYFVSSKKMIYDQIEIVQKFRRLYRGPKFSVNLAKPFFEGDLASRVSKGLDLTPYQKLGRRLKVGRLLSQAGQLYTTILHKILFKIAQK